MKGQKLRLNLEALEVETFGVLSEAAELARGTVKARVTGWGSDCSDCSGCETYDPESDFGWGTVDAFSCGGDASCAPESLNCPSRQFGLSGCTDRTECR